MKKIILLITLFSGFLYSPAQEILKGGIWKINLHGKLQTSTD